MGSYFTGVGMLRPQRLVHQEWPSQAPTLRSKPAHYRQTIRTGEPIAKELRGTESHLLTKQVLDGPTVIRNALGWLCLPRRGPQCWIRPCRFMCRLGLRLPRSGCPQDHLKHRIRIGKLV